MSAPAPIVYEWVGDAMVPARGFQKRCDEQFCVGERYMLEVREDRSAASHRFYFASINEAWKNLPDHLAERFPTADALRKFALVHCGYRDERSIVCSSPAMAQQVAAFIRPIDEYAVVTVHEAVVVVYTPRSQSIRAMDKRTFAESKERVLDFVASLIGTTTHELAQAGEAA